MWEPVTSARSIRWAAQQQGERLHRARAHVAPEAEHRDLLRRSRQAGLADRLGRGRWKYGWDAREAPRLWLLPLHAHSPSRARAAGTTALQGGLEVQWDYYGPFGFAAVLSDLGEPMYDLNRKVTADLLMQKEIAIVGTVEQVIEKIMRIKHTCGYEDFLFTAWFEAGWLPYGRDRRPDAALRHGGACRCCGASAAAVLTLLETTVQLVPESVSAGAVAGS